MICGLQDRVSLKMKNYIFIFLLISGCATYRTNSDINFASTKVPSYETKIIILEEPIKDKQIFELGFLEAEVKKRTVWLDDPTKEQVNYVLIKKAEAIGADAVMNVKYETGAGLTTWGYINASGTAVKFKD